MKLPGVQPGKLNILEWFSKFLFGVDGPQVDHNAEDVTWVDQRNCSVTGI